MKQRFYLILFFVYLLISGGTYGILSYTQPSSNLNSPMGESNISPLLSVDPEAPKDQVCPINGAMFTKAERQAWEQRRPIVAMIENHLQSRPQSGLSFADVVYEAVAEGGITRFMGVFYCDAMAGIEKIAPVRSARMYFVDIAAEYSTPVFVHVGGGNCSMDKASGQCTSHPKAQALEELQDLGWRKPGGNDIDTILDAGVPELTRDLNRLGNDKRLALEHTMVGSLPDLWAQAKERGYTQNMEDGTTWIENFTSWQFKDPADLPGDVTEIAFSFWDGTPDFDVRWQFDQNSLLYTRYQGGQPHTDLETGQPIRAKNIVIQFADEQSLQDIHKHMYYQVIGENDALIFQDGRVIEGTWEKSSQTSRTTFYNQDGEEVDFARGKIWIEIVPDVNAIDY